MLAIGRGSVGHFLNRFEMITQWKYSGMNKWKTKLMNLNEHLFNTNILNMYSHNIKTTDRWIEQHWSSLYNTMFCWEIYHPPKHCCRPPHGYDIPWWHWPFPTSRTMHHTTPQKPFRNDSRKTTKSSTCQSRLQTLLISIRSGIYRMHWNKSDPWRPQLTMMGHCHQGMLLPAGGVLGLQQCLRGGRCQRPKADKHYK